MESMDAGKMDPNGVWEWIELDWVMILYWRWRNGNSLPRKEGEINKIHRLVWVNKREGEEEKRGKEGKEKGKVTL